MIYTKGVNKVAKNLRRKLMNELIMTMDFIGLEFSIYNNEVNVFGSNDYYQCFEEQEFISCLDELDLTEDTKKYIAKTYYKGMYEYISNGKQIRITSSFTPKWEKK